MNHKLANLLYFANELKTLSHTLQLIATMCECRLTIVVLILSCTVLQALSNNFRGGIIMVRPKFGEEPKEVKFMSMHG